MASVSAISFRKIPFFLQGPIILSKFIGPSGGFIRRRDDLKRYNKQ